ncbi:MAG: hypothetical protein WCK01_02960 [Candidatus Uhrbacteria bacterium]
MNIGLDFDGVIADGDRLKSAVLLDQYGIHIPPELCKRKFAVQRGYVSEEVYEDVLRRVFEDEYMHSQIVPIPGAVDGIRELMDKGFFPRIVTARGPAAGQHVAPWLRQHGLDLPVTCVGRYGLKTEACKGLGAFVDDNLIHLLPLKDKVPRLFLFGSRLETRPTWTPNGIKRVARWTHLQPRFRKYARVA